MNICIPYTYMVNDLFRCLSSDFHIAFTAAPVPGRYTRQIGKMYGGESLCEGLSTVLGSVCECYYLGADTALVFAPCGECSAQRIRLKIHNCLEANGVKMNVVCVSPFCEEGKAIFAFLKQNSTVSFLEYRAIKQQFYECSRLLAHFSRLCASVSQSAPTLERYLHGVQEEIKKTSSLFDLKILLRTILKKMQPFESAPATVPQGRTFPYADEDYFDLKNALSFGDFFERKPAQRAAAGKSGFQKSCVYNVVKAFDKKIGGF